jgi:hypothetical protein
MAASRMSVVVSSSDDGRDLVPEVPAGTAVDGAGPAVAGAAVVGGAVVLAVGGTVPPGTDVLPGRLDVGLPGVVELPCPGACAEAGRGAAAAISAAQQIPAVTRRRRIRRHRLTESETRAPTPSLTAARR